MGSLLQLGRWSGQLTILLIATGQFLGLEQRRDGSDCARADLSKGDWLVIAQAEYLTPIPGARGVSARWPHAFPKETCSRLWWWADPSENEGRHVPAVALDVAICALYRLSILASLGRTLQRWLVR
jgi:hypothetical protein